MMDAKEFHVEKTRARWPARSATALSAMLFLLMATVMVPMQAQAATTVAALRIFAWGTGTGGHSWVVVTNTSSSVITVGLVNVAPDDTVSVGTWGNKPDGHGVYYNIEKYYGGATWNGRVSLVTSLTSAQLGTVSSSIKNHNSWSLANNCSSFSSRVWNSVASTKVDPGTLDTPAHVVSSIKSKSGYSTNVSFGTTPASSLVKRQNGSSSTSSVSSGTLTSSSSGSGGSGG